MHKISLFDLDHTLLSANSSFAFGAYLYKQNVFSTYTMLKLVFLYASHKAGFLTLSKLHTKNFNQMFLSRPFASIQKHIAPFMEQNLEKLLYQPAIAKLEQAKANNHFTAILSNSPDFLVREIAAYFGVNEWKATPYALDSQGIFSSIPSFFQGEDKAHYLNELCARFNLEKENTIAYSDSLLDLPFLEAAGQAVAVNPDRKLKCIARQNRWDII